MQTWWNGRHATLRELRITTEYMQEWWNGRHAALRGQWTYVREGSNPFSCTNLPLEVLYLRAFFYTAHLQS